MIKAIKTNKYALLFIVSLAFVGVSAWVGWSHSQGAVQTRYITASIDRGRVTKIINATGSISAVNSVDVGTQLSGRIDQVYVDFNDEVNKDQPIAQLNQKKYQAEMDEAAAALDVARANVKMHEAGLLKAHAQLASVKADTKSTQAALAKVQASHTEASKLLERHLSLSKKGLASRELMDRAQANFDVSKARIWEANANLEARRQKVAIAEADVSRAEAQLMNAQAVVPQRQAKLDLVKAELENTIIRSPIDGIVIAREVERGQTVAASLEAPKLFTIAKDLRQIEVYVKVDEADIGQVRKGQKATFSVDAYPGTTFQGEVIQIRKLPSRTGSVVTYTVVIASENQELMLLPGMTALVRIIVYQGDDVLRVPARAVQYRPPGLESKSLSRENRAMAAISDGRVVTVWVPAANNSANPVEVRVGYTDLRYSELLSDNLTEGQEVIIDQSAE